LIPANQASSGILILMRNMNWKLTKFNRYGRDY
jgi:hypothetical protein